MNYSKDFTRSHAGRNTMTDSDYAHVGRAYRRWRDRRGFVVQAHSADLADAITVAWNKMKGGK
jgi:hypothetical protein